MEKKSKEYYILLGIVSLLLVLGDVLVALQLTSAFVFYIVGNLLWFYESYKERNLFSSSILILRTIVSFISIWTWQHTDLPNMLIIGP